MWLSNLKEHNSKLQRWKIKLEEYNFKVEYVPGKDNVVADALSRIKLDGLGSLNNVVKPNVYGNSQQDSIDLQDFNVSEFEINLMDDE